MKQIQKIISDVEDMHPYKIVGHFDTFSEYNQGWTDACSEIEGRINELINSIPKKKTPSQIAKGLGLMYGLILVLAFLILYPLDKSAKNPELTQMQIFLEYWYCYFMAIVLVVISNYFYFKSSK